MLIYTQSEVMTGLRKQSETEDGREEGIRRCCTETRVEEDCHAKEGRGEILSKREMGERREQVQLTEKQQKQGRRTSRVTEKTKRGAKVPFLSSISLYPSIQALNRTEAYCSNEQIPAVCNQRHRNTNNVGHHAADNIVSQPGNIVIDIILEKKEAFLGSNLERTGTQQKQEDKESSQEWQLGCRTWIVVNILPIGCYC